jgi:hypothetical protein
MLLAMICGEGRPSLFIPAEPTCLALCRRADPERLAVATFGPLSVPEIEQNTKAPEGAATGATGGALLGGALAGW